MKDNEMKKASVFSNLIWRFAERCGAQGVSFLVSIVLARLLAPEVYGTIALITVFTTMLNVFVDSGLANSLIQKQNADNIDFSTVFFFNIFVCLALYAGVFFAAPSIARFYNDIELVPVIRVLSLTLVISGVKNVQQAYVSRYLMFKKFFFATLGGTIAAAVVGIIMAFSGFGIWALVAQQVINQAIDTIILWITVKWRPNGQFSFARLKGLFSYGWKLLASSLLDRAYENLRQLIIGKLYSSSDLAYYNQGDRFPNLIIANINSSIDSVLFPVMSDIQDDREHVKNMTRRSIKTSVYIMAPMMMGICFIATPLVRLLLTEKWLPCVPFMRIFCITYIFYPIHTSNLNAIKAMGRSDLFLKLEIVKEVLGFVILLCAMKFGVMIMAYSVLIESVCCQIINSWPNRKLLNYGYLEQLKDIVPCILLAVFMGVCVNFVTWIGLPDILTIIIQIIFGVVIYLAGSIIFRIDSFQYLWSIVKPMLIRHKA